METGPLLAVSGILGTAAGATLGFFAHVYVQRRTGQRERVAALRAAYASFFASGFEYLDAYLENRRRQDWAAIEFHEPDDQPDWLDMATGDHTIDLQASYRLLRESRRQLNQARCRALILEPRAQLRSKLDHVYSSLESYAPIRVGTEAETNFAAAKREEKDSMLVAQFSEYTRLVAQEVDRLE